MRLRGPVPGARRRRGWVRRGKNSLIFWVVRLVVAALSGLSHRLALRLGGLLGLLAWRVAGTERRRAQRNLMRSDLGGSAPETVARQMFVHLGQNALECVVMGRLRPRLGPSDGLIRFTPGSLEALEQGLAEKRGLLFVTAHLGNWELMAAAVARQAPVSVLFKPSYDPRFTRLIDDFRRNNGILGIDVTRPGHLKAAVRTLMAGHVLGILLDQPVSGGAELPFFGAPAATSLAVPRLARITGAPVVVGTIHREGLCQHAISIQKMGGNLAQIDPKRATLALCSHLEQAIRKHPSQWIWSLDRWRSTESSRLSRPIANCIPASNN